jgi:hypothetical protein
MRALAKQPAQRFPDAEAMRAALDDVPVLDSLAARAATAVREEQATTRSLVEIIRPSLPRRMWSRLRYGRWRWRLTD